MSQYDPDSSTYMVVLKNMHNSGIVVGRLFLNSKVGRSNPYGDKKKIR